jgi:predicted tellurium resistance membrane protein TerC
MDFLTADALVALVTLTAMEIVLGIDNIVFIAILVGRLPAERREKVRRTGIVLALLMRLGLLFALTWLMGLTRPLFAVFDHAFSGRDLVLLVGGLFLIGKSAHEMWDKLEGPEPGERGAPKAAAVAGILLQIIALDIVFSLDSVITAVGMAREVWVMVAAMIAAVGVMLIFAKAIGDFVDRHPSVKLLALSFLLLIGVMLLAEGFGQHIPKGYIYFSMAFALGVELLNMRFRKVHGAPVQLHARMAEGVAPASREADADRSAAG